MTFANAAVESMSALERRATLAKARGGKFCDYSENVPKWPADVARSATLPVGSYPPVGGLQELRRAIADREQTRLGLGLTDDNVTITNGAMHALSLIFRLLNGPVLCQAPLFKTIFDQLTSMAVGASLFGDWPQGRSAIERAVQLHGEARIIYINLPNNPTGMVLDQSSVDFLVEFCVRHGKYLIVDMVYDDFVFRQAQLPRAPRSGEDLNRIFVVNSFSKNYGAPDLRLGWVVSSPQNIRHLNGALERDCITVAGGSQETALGLMRRGNADLVEAVWNGREIVRAMARDHHTLKLQTALCGTQFLWNFGNRNVADFADYLLLHHATLISTSENYAGARRTFIRLPLGYPRKTIQTAIESIRVGFDEWLQRATPDNRSAFHPPLDALYTGATTVADRDSRADLRP
jgi:aspartate aminotransferase